MILGSFNVSCGISDLALSYEDEVGLVLLNGPVSREQPEWWDAEEGKFLHVQATDLYKPFLPPVFGKYDDYGRIENVQESVTTQLLEKIFKRPINVVLDCASQDRSIYYSDGEIAENYMLEGHKLDDYDSSFEEQLLSLGFGKAPREKGAVDAWQFCGFALEKLNDGQSFRIREMKTNRVVLQKFNARFSDGAEAVVSIFAEQTKVYPGFRPEEFAAVRALGHMSGMFFHKEIFEKMVPAINDEYLKADNIVRLRGDFDEFMDYYDKPKNRQFYDYASSWAFTSVEFIHREMQISPEMYDELRVYKGHAEEFYQVQDLLNILDKTNRMFTPTRYVNQEDGDEATYALNAITGEVLAKRKADWDEENGWDETEEEVEKRKAELAAQRQKFTADRLASAAKRNARMRGEYDDLYEEDGASKAVNN